MSAQRNSRRRLVQTSGHTLIELMVAIIIGLLMVLASFKVLAVFEGHKRTTTAMSDAMQSGNFGLYQLDKLIRSAGTGITQYGLLAGYGCPLTYTPTGGAKVTGGAVTLPSTPINFAAVFSGAGVNTLRLAPAVIFPDSPAAGTDSLLLMLGGAGYSEVPNAIAPPLTSSNVTVDNTVGFVPNEWILLGNAGAGGCTLTHIGGGYVESPDNLVLPVTDDPAGFDHGYVIPLGLTTAANFMMYGVANNSLYALDLLNTKLDATSSQQVSDDIVAVKAVYGISSSGPTGVMDTWVKPVNGTYTYAPATLLGGGAAASNLLKQIKAIRVAVVIRAPLLERHDPDPAANDTNSFNAGSYTLFKSLPTAAQYVYTVPAAQTNYRFRVIEATIPLRNGYF